MMLTVTVRVNGGRIVQMEGHEDDIDKILREMKAHDHLVAALEGLLPIIETTFPQQQGVWLEEARRALGIANGTVCAGSLRSGMVHFNDKYQVSCPVCGQLFPAKDQVVPNSVERVPDHAPKGVQNGKA